MGNAAMQRCRAPHRLGHTACNKSIERETAPWTQLSVVSLRIRLAAEQSTSSKLPLYTICWF